MDESYELIVQARTLAEQKKYDEAFEMFCVSFEQNPELITVHELDFRHVLLMLNSKLAKSEVDIIFNNFDRALKLYPDNIHLLNDIGKYLYRFGYINEAWEHFQKILNLSPSYSNAQKNLNSIKNMLVERWHYRMLNDNFRNETYRKAIHQTILSQEDRVLDVGTGTGLLAIYANETGALHIIGCDSSDLMAHIAEKIVRGNQLRNIKIVNKLSTDLNLWDSNGRCAVLLTEMFDAGLFGEHVLQMLSHAWTFLLTKTATVLPNAAEFFIAGVQCDHLGKNYKMSYDSKKLLNISSLDVHAFMNGETYDCEDVHLIKDIKYLTEPQSLLNINFNDVKDIKNTLNRTEPYHIKLKAKANGQMNIVVGWFNLYLTDLIMLTTNPLDNLRANAWQQAVFFDDIPRDVMENEPIEMEFLMNGGKLTKVPSSKKPITRVSVDVIRFLNDFEYLKMITECLGMASVYLGQLAEMSEITIVDLCPFPVFGMHMIKRGAKSLFCCAINDYDKEFIIKVFRENKVSLSNVSIILGENWTEEVFEDQQFHAIFTNILDICGDVNLRLKDVAVHLKQSHLIQGGLYMPAAVKFVVQLVNSNWVDLNNKVFDENVSNYPIGKHINEYSVTQNFSIDFSTLKYTPISEPVVLCNYPDGLNYEAKLVEIVNKGCANAILCWYIVELMEKTQQISTNRPNSFISGMLFVTYSEQELAVGKLVKIIQYKDSDDCFKIVMNIDT